MQINSNQLISLENCRIPVEKTLNSWLGRIVLWISKKVGYIPYWIKDFIVKSKQFEQMILKWKSEEIELSPEINQCFIQSQATLQKIIPKVNAGQFLKCIPFQPPIITSSSKKEWHLNLALLMHAYKKTENPKQKKLFAFLALNYLAKAAPICPEDWSLDNSTKKKFEDMFQLGLLNPGVSYNRESPIFDFLLRSYVTAKLSLGVGQQYYFLDTKNISSLLPLSFHVPKDFDQLKQLVAGHFVNHDCSTFMDRPIILETADEESLNAKIEQLSETLSKQKNINKDTIAVWLRMNIICISCFECEKVPILHILPLFNDPKFYTCPGTILGCNSQNRERLPYKLLDLKFSKAKGELENFINATGIRLGAINGRKAIFNFMSLEDLLQKTSEDLSEYSVVGKNAHYYKTPQEIVSKNFFKRLLHNFEKDKGFLHILGYSTLQLISGLMEDIAQEKWDSLNQCSATRQIIQSTLYQLEQHLAMADLHAEDFTQFTKWIELAHYEIATLLTLFMPYKKTQFESIYKNRLQQIIPPELREHFKAGLTKSAMNTFAGLYSTNPAADLVVNKGSHFELVEFIGKKAQTQKVDLYLQEFNHNVSLYSDHQEYAQSNIIEEIETVLREKPATQNLTIAVDCTIEFVESERVKKLLAHYSSRILEGKLNFVFFRSGQKFDMLGMDNYYGSPFFMINNGDEQWKAFDQLFTADTYQTDLLSHQWFCLINKHAPKSLDLYRKQIFDNAKAILAQVPESLKAGKIRVSSVKQDAETCFIDIKCYGKDREKIINEIEQLFYRKFAERGSLIHARGGYGYFYPNISLFKHSMDGGDCMTMRVNPGLNEKDNALILEVLQEVSGS